MYTVTYYIIIPCFRIYTLAPWVSAVGENFGIYLYIIYIIITSLVSYVLHPKNRWDPLVLSFLLIITIGDTFHHTVGFKISDNTLAVQVSVLNYKMSDSSNPRENSISWSWSKSLVRWEFTNNHIHFLKPPYYLVLVFTLILYH